MIYIEIDKLNTDDFIVNDEDDNPVTGLIKSDFTIELYNPDKNDIASDSGVVIDIEEVDNGIYRISYTPTELGNWTTIIYHSIYFPWGKGENYRCVESLGGESGVKDLVERILGLCQENFRIFNQEYDRNNNLLSGLVKIYPSATDCDDDTSPIAQYQMSAVFNNRNQLTGYKMKRIV